MQKYDRNALGRFGEDKAVEYLTARGFRILTRNFRCRLGEIDIISQQGRCLVFTEVKLRKDDLHGAAAEFVSRTKQKKVLLAAEYYLMLHPSVLQPRFDVVEVYAPEGTGGETEIRLIEDAFQ